VWFRKQYCLFFFSDYSWYTFFFSRKRWLVPSWKEKINWEQKNSWYLYQLLHANNQETREYREITFSNSLGNIFQFLQRCAIVFISIFAAVCHSFYFNFCMRRDHFNFLGNIFLTSIRKSSDFYFFTNSCPLMS
jgi:hypothetical protein